MKKYFVLFITLIISSCSTTRNLNSYMNYSVWDEIINNFSLDNYSHKPQVKIEINNYIKNKKDFELSLKRAAPYLYHIKTIINSRNLPGEIALIPIVESQYKPFAYSWAGATGLWQMMPGTASGLGLTINWWKDERRDIIKSTDAATKYLIYLHKYFDKKWILAIASYDSGAGTIERAMKKSKQGDFWQLTIPKETAKYIPKLFAIQEILSNPKKYNIKIPYINNKPYFESVTMTQPLALKTVARLAQISTEEVRTLNPSFRRWSTSAKGSYKLFLPIKSIAIFKSNLAHHKFKNAHKHLQKYKIKHGDNLSKIAKKYNTQVAKIIAINQMSSTQLVIGSTIWLPKNKFLILPGFTIKQTKTIQADNNPGPLQKTYTVKKHDSLNYIARKTHTSKAKIIYWNQIKNPKKIRPGTQIITWHNPVKNKVIFYKIKKGDTLIKLAKKFKISIDRIKHYNQITHNRIIVGKTLKIK